MPNDYGSFIRELQSAISGSLAWIGTQNVDVSGEWNPSDFRGSSYGVVLVPREVPGDERGIGRWYRKHYSADVYCCIKSGMPEGTRIMGLGTWTIGIGSFVDTVRDTLRNNRLNGFLDHHIGAGIGNITYDKGVAENKAVAHFPFDGRKLFNDT